MQKKNYIVESMYAKYTDKVNTQQKKLNESAQDMWVLVPTQNRYDDPIDVKKFAKEYGIFDSMSKAFDKAEELAPDRWDAFVPVRLSESFTEARNPENDEVNATVDAVKQTKERHNAKKKNESLSLNESSGTEYEIYFSDLTPEAQKDLLDFVGIASPKELNWDVYPIAMLFDFSNELEEI